MAEKSKRVASSVDVKRRKKSFPMWIPVAIILALIGAYFAKNMTGNSGGSGSFKKVTGEVDATSMDQWSYANGYAIGKDIKTSTDQLEEGNKVDQKVVAQGITDALLGADAKLTEEQITQIYTARQQEFLEEKTKAGTAFIEEFKKGDGVVAEENGVAYKVLTQGSGATVGKDIAIVTYTGKKIDGTVFDSTENNGGKPSPFMSSSVIPGLGPILEKMRVGAKYEIVVPSELAYGPQGIQGVIDPNETLVFDIEVTKIEPAPAQAQTPPPAAEQNDTTATEEEAEDADEASDEEADDKETDN